MKMVNDINNLYKFMDNMNMNTGHVSNVYVARLYSPNGDVKEYYGMNLLTDLGFNQFFNTDSTISFADKLYVGDGTGSFDKTSSQLMSALFDGAAASTVDSSILYNYPLYYARGDQNDNGRITTVTRYKMFRYNENIENVLSDVVISEYGVGTAWNALWTHSYVYDLQGDRAVIIKHPGERLDIEVFFCCSFLESLIMSGWSDNNYTAITTGGLMMKQMNVVSSATFKRSDYNNRNGRIERTISSRSRSAVIDSKITKTTNMATFILNSNVENDRYIDGFVFEAPGFLSFSKQQRPEPENVTTEFFYSHDPFDKSGFADAIGRDISISQMDVISVNAYNVNTDTWSLSRFYNNSSTHLFDETPMNVEFALPYYYTNNNIVETLYLYQNLNIDDPILSIRGNIETIYATDKYWYGPNLPGNDWIRITNRESVPAAAQRKRYWLMDVNNVAPNPVRAGTFYLMKTQDDYGEKFTPTKYRDLIYGMGFSTLDNMDYNISISFGVVSEGTNYVQFFDMENNWIETAALSSSTPRWVSTFGKWVFVDMNSGTYKLYDISTISQHVLNPPTDLVGAATNGHHSENEMGLICATGSGNRIDIIDLRTTPTVTTLQTVKSGCCMWRTTYVAYVKSNENKLIIYDVDTSTNVYEFNLPTELTSSSVNMMIGHTQKVWLITSSTMFVCDISTGEFTQSANPVTTSTTYGGKYKCTDKLIALYGDQTASTFRTHMYVLSVDDIDTVRDITSTDIGASVTSRSIIGERVHVIDNSIILFADVVYSYTGEQRGEQYFHYFDLGVLLATGSKRHISVTKTAYSKGFIYDEYFVYEGTMYPLTNFIPIKITCRTKTITSATGQKAVSNKQFSITVSNTPTFNGKPPGSIN